MTREREVYRVEEGQEPGVKKNLGMKTNKIHDSHGLLQVLGYALSASGDVFEENTRTDFEAEVPQRIVRDHRILVVLQKQQRLTKS